MTSDLVLVLTTPSILEGEIVRSRLEDEGIPVLLKGGGDDPYRMGPSHVFVPADLEVQARLVLDSLTTTDEDLREETRAEPEA
jgi:hypothetical protein